MTRWWIYHLLPIPFGMAVALGAAAWANHAVKLEREACLNRGGCIVVVNSSIVCLPNRRTDHATCHCD